MFDTPILFLIFNRPDTTKQVFEKIRAIQPTQLFIAADGPRVDKLGESELCQQTREWVLHQIDWDCNVTTRFQEQNLGCGKHVSGAITWFFEQVEEGIILEDDCVPDMSFFPYCAELLERYRDNEQVYVIGGNVFQNAIQVSTSYYFSAYAHIWGWASWRRAWKTYQFSLETVSDTFFESCIQSYFSKSYEIDYWKSIFSIMKHSPIDTWDYQWLFTSWFNNGINIVPQKNLVTNIGFREDATHTFSHIDGISKLDTHAISKITHPTHIKIKRKADIYTFYKIYGGKPKRKNAFIQKCKDKCMYELRKLKQITQ